MEQPKKKTGFLSNIKGNIKGKIEEVKKNWKQAPQSQVQKIDEQFLEESSSSDTLPDKEFLSILIPKPDQACNKVIKRLLESKQIEQQGSLKVKDQASKIINSINKQEVDIIALQKLSFNGIPDEIKGIRPLVWRILLRHLPTDTS